MPQNPDPYSPEGYAALQKLMGEANYITCVGSMGAQIEEGDEFEMPPIRIDVKPTPDAAPTPVCLRVYIERITEAEFRKIQEQVGVAGPQTPPGPIPLPAETPGPLPAAPPPAPTGAKGIRVKKPT